jgi:hypothetical protein
MPLPLHYSRNVSALGVLGLLSPTKYHPFLSKTFRPSL